MAGAWQRSVVQKGERKTVAGEGDERPALGGRRGEGRVWKRKDDVCRLSVHTSLSCSELSVDECVDETTVVQYRRRRSTAGRREGRTPGRFSLSSRPVRGPTLWLSSRGKGDVPRGPHAWKEGMTGGHVASHRARVTRRMS